MSFGKKKMKDGRMYGLLFSGLPWLFYPKKIVDAGILCVDL